jgi:hypothetical protein
MDRQRTGQRWLTEATPALRRVTGAERRFSASLQMNEVTMLAASDELGAATRDAMAWMTTNACPDQELGSRVALMLQTCAEVAVTAQRTVTHPSGDIEAVLGRLGNLLAIIEIHSHALDSW